MIWPRRKRRARELKVLLHSEGERVERSISKGCVNLWELPFKFVSFCHVLPFVFKHGFSFWLHLCQGNSSKPSKLLQEVQAASSHFLLSSRCFKLLSLHFARSSCFAVFHVQTDIQAEVNAGVETARRYEEEVDFISFSPIFCCRLEAEQILAEHDVFAHGFESLLNDRPKRPSKKLKVSVSIPEKNHV